MLAHDLKELQEAKKIKWKKKTRTVSWLVHFSIDLKDAQEAVCERCLRERERERERGGNV